MKKRALSISLSLVFAFLFAAPVFAADETHVVVGLKSWYARWRSGSKQTNGGQRISVRSGNSVFLAGPSLKISKGRFFSGITYVASTQDFKFDLQTKKDSMSRNDLDAIAGFMVHPRVGLFAGFKYIHGTSRTVEPGRADWTSDFRLYGASYGVAVNYPVEGTSVVLAGSASYIPVKFRDRGGTSGREVNKTRGFMNVYEGSASYALSNKLSVNAGYKHQTFKASSLAGVEIFSGYTFGADYRFN